MIKQFEEIALDNTSGATELIHRLLGVCEAAIMSGDFDGIRSGVESLLPAQRGLPSFHAVLHTLKRDFLPLLEHRNDSTQALGYIASLQQLLDDSASAIARNFLTFFPEPKILLTMSRSKTVISSIFIAQEEKRIDHIFVMESRPMQEGLKTIHDFQDRKISTTLITDAAMAEAVGHCNFVVVGADGISADGFLLNKTGTYALALICAQLRKPMYVLCDSLKFSPQLRHEIIVEEKPAAEVVKLRKTDTFKVWNRYFDWTPMDLITAFVTEKGNYAPEEITQMFGAGE